MFLGCVTILSPLWSTVCGLFVYAITVGLLSNSYGFIKASAVLLLDADRFIDAYSWMMFFEGIGTTLGPLLAGMTYHTSSILYLSLHAHCMYCVSMRMVNLFIMQSEKMFKP